MTSFLVLAAADSRAPSSIYFVSDSRISFYNRRFSISTSVWDHGRKVFFCRNSPEIFGYVGDVLFPSLILSQIVESIDHGLFYPDQIKPDDKFSFFKNQITALFEKYPEFIRSEFTITYATKEGHENFPKFFFYKLNWNGVWKEEQVEVPSVSSALWLGGSGGEVIKKWQTRWQSSSQGRTSRSEFSAFCDALHSGEDKYTGGTPQIVGIYRNTNGRCLGVVDGNEKFILGMPVVHLSDESSIEWRNTAFERCGPDGKLIKGAQVHVVPKGLGIPNHSIKKK